uniref:RING-type domain-containing protein n=1 Tax=Strigamia maritima TaxID=126957 RepID=T1J7S0_STRMM
MVQAKQTPEPIFDLSDCGLKEVPTGVYSWCKVCLKEALLLQDNYLASLSDGGNLKDLSQLQVLDLHNNDFRKLPPDIGNITKLQVFYLNNNSLNTLPQSMKLMKHLKTLNISGNKFQEFPLIICELKQLRTLDISNNSITNLPSDLAYIRTLDTLILDANNMVYPAAAICKQGTETIMRYLCKENDIEYVPPSKAIATLAEAQSSSSFVNNEYEERLSDYWTQLESQKEKKRQGLIAMERDHQEHFLGQAEIIKEMQKKRLQLLEDVSVGQNQLENELAEAQLKKDKARQSLISTLLQVEQDSYKVIEELLAMAEKSHNVEAIMENEKRERQDFEELFLRKQEQEQLNKKEVLNAMTQMLQGEEMLQFQNLMRAETTSRLCRENEESAELLELVLTKKSSEQIEAVSRLLSQEIIQKEALLVLMSKRDAESVYLRDQVTLIQDELAKLTMLELKQKSLNIKTQQEILGQKREILTQLLVQALEQQKMRRGEMNRRLEEMEEQRLTDQQDYWLIQYQRLMAHKPASVIEMEAQMDPLVKSFLNRAELSEYISLFARNMISYVQLMAMGKEELKEIGIFNPLVITTILNTMEAIRREKNPVFDDDDLAPSTSRTPSAPEIKTHTEVECVVCMEKPCNMLFLHCGHVCCCETCALNINICPMCRGEIVQSFLLRFAE